jgi:DNA-binding MarR family transcriptional regulator
MGAWVSTDRDRLVEDLNRVMQRNVQETVRFHGAVADQLGLHVTDLHCLGALFDMGSATAGDLAVRLGLTTGAITRVVDRLVEKGYARRVADPRDRRRVVVEIVPDGVGEVGTQFAGMAMHLENQVAKYTDEQVRFLLDFLRAGVEVARAETDRLRREGKAHGTRRPRSGNV